MSWSVWDWLGEELVSQENIEEGWQHPSGCRLPSGHLVPLGHLQALYLDLHPCETRKWARGVRRQGAERRTRRGRGGSSEAENKDDERAGPEEEDDGGRTVRWGACPDDGREKGGGWQALWRSVNAVPGGKERKRETEENYVTPQIWPKVKNIKTLMTTNS